MERDTRTYGIINLITLVGVGLAAQAVARYCHSLAGGLSVIFLGVAALVTAVGWFQMRLEERERLEKLEFEELAKSSGSSAMFTARETEVFPAQRSREQFEKFFVPGVAVLLLLVEIGGSVLIWRSLRMSTQGAVAQPLVCLGMFGMFFLVLFLLGRFSTGVARMENLRLLRPGATWLLLCAYLCLVVLAGTACSWTGFVRVDFFAACALDGVLALIGIETLINLILELYRPRVKGRIERPLYESRLVSLLGQPEGLIKTTGQTLDYYFGFKVTETWFFQMLARWIPWLIAGQLGLLMLSTTVVFLEPGEQALLERNGRFVGVLNPGVHFKLPWPFDRAYRYPTEQIQTVEVGHEAGEGPETGNIILWTLEHAKEDNFIVANRSQAPAAAATNTSRPPPAVSLLTVSIPVHFQVTNLQYWVYSNDSPRLLLEQLATREVVHYLVSADFNEMMSTGRFTAAGTLRERIQAEADAHQLGVGVLFVGLEDIHPPVNVAKDFEKVVAESHTANAKMSNAVAAAISSAARATITAQRLKSEASSDRLARETNALAVVDLFNDELPAYHASPSVFRERAMLDMFAQSITNTRLYVLLATNTHKIAILNLEDKFGGFENLLSLPGPPEKTNAAAR